MDEEFGTCELAGTRVEAALCTQPGWKVSLGESELGQAIRFKRFTAEYEVVSETSVGGLIGTASFNSWHVRKDFLALQSAQEALAFFTKYGPFMFEGEWDRRGWPDPQELNERQMGASVDWAMKWMPSIQALYNEALLNPPASWLPPDGKKRGIDERCEEWARLEALGRIPEMDPHGGLPPYFTMTAFCVRDAIASTLFLDQCAKKTHKGCERCGKVFALKSQHKQRFCDENCGSAKRIAQSRVRARQAKAASQAGR